MNGRGTSVSVMLDAPRSGNSLSSPDPVGLLYRMEGMKVLRKGGRGRVVVGRGVNRLCSDTGKP